MGFQRGFLSFLLSALAAVTLVAQPNKYGVPLITNYPFNITGGSEQNWCATQDARGVMYFGNVDKGVLEYDGVEWRNIPVSDPSPMIRSLVAGDNGVVYVGAVSEFGYLAPDNLGDMHYVSLSDTIDQEEMPFSEVWKTYYLDGKVYFCTVKTIFVYDTELDKISHIELTPYAFNSYLIDSTFYISDFGEGLMKYQDNSFVAVNGGDYFREKLIMGLVKYDDSRLLVGTDHYGIYLFDIESGRVDPSFLDPGLQVHLQSGYITNVQPLNNDFIISSLYTGLVILSKDGKAKEIISEAEGLYDNNIANVYSNAQMKGSGPLWIANYMGVSKLETYIPFRQFTEASGFTGFITDITEFNGKIFVSTFSGIYYKSSTSTSTRFIPVPEMPQEKVTDLQTFKSSSNVELLIASAESNTFILDNKLNVSSISDLVINPHPGLQEREEYWGRSVIQDPKKRDVIYTGKTKLVKLQYTRGKWREVMRVVGLTEDILERLQIDKYGYLWANTDRNVIRIDIALTQDATVEFFGVEDGLPALERNTVFLDPDSEEVLLGTLDGFYRFNYFNDTMYRDTIHNSILPYGQNEIWAFTKDDDGDYWYSFENEFTGNGELVARKNDGKMEVIWDKTFQRLPNASTDVFFSDPDKGMWFGKSNKLYHFDKTISRNDSLPFRVLIRKVTINYDSLLFNGTNFIEDDPGIYRVQLAQAEDTQPQIKHKYNNIEFSWAAPYFVTGGRIKVQLYAGRVRREMVGMGCRRIQRFYQPSVR